MTAYVHPAVEPYTRLDHDILVIETGYANPGYDAAYLIRHAGRAAFIDSGVNSSVPRLLAALDFCGLAPEAVDWVLLTHVHLDHAGGAGRLLAALPNARLGVHPRGARHMIDPRPLMKAVRLVYGPEFTDREYGTLVPVPEQRLVALDEGASVDIGGRRLDVIDSPGHARHHICLWDAQSAGWFTGDAFGMCLRGFRTDHGHAIVPTSSPSQFDPAAMHGTVARLLARAPRAVFPTHYGEVLHPERLAPFLLAQVDAQVAAAQRIGGAPENADAMQQAFAEIYLQALQAQGWQGGEAELRAIMGVDIQLNVDGVRLWLEHSRGPAS